jgi:hypothetical protein
MEEYNEPKFSAMVHDPKKVFCPYCGSSILEVGYEHGMSPKQCVCGKWCIVESLPCYYVYKLEEKGKSEGGE